MPLSKRVLLVLYVALLVPWAAAPALSLRGRVTDESGAVVHAAKVVLNAPDGLVKTSVASGDGSYSSPFDISKLDPCHANRFEDLPQKALSKIEATRKSRGRS